MRTFPLALFFVAASATCLLRAADGDTDSSRDQPVSLNKVVITGQRADDVLPVVEQEQAPNIEAVTTADQIESLPDVNAAEALRRVPGISLWTDTGEGRFVAIRGIDSDLNSTTFEGIRLLPTNPATIFGGGRAVALDVIPSGLVGAMTVTKTNRPDQDAEALGGTVDIEPKALPSGRMSFIDGRFGTGYEPLRDTPVTDLSLTGGVRFGAGEAPAASQPFSLVGSVSFYTDARGIDDVEPAINDATATDRSLAGYDQRYYLYHRYRHAYGVTLGYQPNADNRVSLTLMDSGYTEKKLDNILSTNFDGNFTTADNKVFTDTISDGGYEKTLANHQEKLTERAAILSGEDKLADSRLTYALARVTGQYRVLKDESTTFDSVGSGVVTYDNSGDYPTILSATGPNKAVPSNYFLKGYRSSVPLNETGEDTIQAAYDMPVDWFGRDHQDIQVGASYRDKTYHADTLYRSGPANAVGSPSLSNYVEGSDVVFYHQHYENGPNLSPSLTDNLIGQGGWQQSGGNVASTLNAHAYDTEKISAAFAEYTIVIDRLTAIAGIRVEDSRGRYTGYLVSSDVYAGTVTYAHTYTDAFPALELTYKLDEGWLVRASRSSTIARPGFNQVSANTQVDTSSNSVATGNPNLKPTLAASYDVSVEHYVGRDGLATAGVFYKDLSDYIVSDVAFLNPSDPRLSGDGFTGNHTVTDSTYANVSGAKAYGVELAYEQHFRELPGVFSGLGVSGNLTLVSSSFAIRPGESHTLPSTARSTYNLSALYDHGPLSLRVSLAHVDRYLSGIGGDATQDLYTDPVNWLDAGLQWRIAEGVEVYFNAKNLLNTPIRYSQGTMHRTIQREFYGPTFQTGIALKY